MESIPSPITHRDSCRSLRKLLGPIELPYASFFTMYLPGKRDTTLNRRREREKGNASLFLFLFLFFLWPLTLAFPFTCPCLISPAVHVVCKSSIRRLQRKGQRRKLITINQHRFCLVPNQGLTPFIDECPTTTTVPRHLPVSLGCFPISKPIQPGPADQYRIFKDPNTN